MEIRILENYLKIKVLKIKFKIRILKNYLKMEALKIIFENWNFGKLFKHGNYENWNLEKLFENGYFENLILTCEDEE